MTTPHFTRRAALAIVGGAGVAAALSGAARAVPKGPPPLSALEAHAGGRLGAALIQGARTVAHRGDERFALCSSFKLPLAALILRETEAGRLDPAEMIPFGEKDLLGWAPAARANLQAGRLSIIALAEAVQVQSDNTAANLLLTRLGGVDPYNAFLREIGDTTTRLDTMEPHVGMAAPDGVGNTTTPEAMARTVLTLVEGDALSPANRATLLRWMQATGTGPRRLKAGIPAEWKLGHKTGTQAASEAPNMCIDIGIAYPPNGAPLAIAAYYEGPVRSEQTRPEDEAVLAEVGRLATAWAS